MLIPGRSYFARQFPIDVDLISSIDKIDQLWVEGGQLTIKEARELVAMASQQPFGAARLLVIEGADALSESIQNTLLKLIEEPPTYLIVVLTGKQLDAFLPTLRSRLHDLGVAAGVENYDDLPEGFLTDLELTKKILEKAKDRQEVIDLLRRAFPQLRQAIMNKPNEANIQRVEIADSTIRRLGQNTNQKLTIDSLLLNWPFN